MKSFGKYISKNLISFGSFIIILVLVNIVIYGLTFYQIINKNYGGTSPQNMLEQIANASTEEGISDDAINKLRDDHIWAMMLSSNGDILWSVDLPEDLSHSYTVQDVALFSKDYIDDYPVFVWNSDSGLLVLGYPKGSYTKITTNYFPTSVIKTMPIFVFIIFAFDLLALFVAYYISKRKILINTEPIIDSIEALSHGKPVSLSVHGELTDVADGLNRASKILSNQNAARANWISGVSHDIRTPLSMIMGYADRMATDSSASDATRTQATIVRAESIKIKELVGDLNLVSQLEYEMQPLKLKQIKLSKLLRSFVADTLNIGIPDLYSLDLIIEPNIEQLTFNCDNRLIVRALSNLIQNSIKHNPTGCAIQILLRMESDAAFQIVVMDDGAGISTDKLKEIQIKPHYMESTDEGLDLRHGLGLVLVQQITYAHSGNLQISNRECGGFQVIFTFGK